MMREIVDERRWEGRGLLLLSCLVALVVSWCWVELLSKKEMGKRELAQMDKH